MPGNVVKLSNARKHYTNEEKSRRAAAENVLTRDKIRLTIPAYVKNNQAALLYWKKIRKEMREVELLDNLDADTLGRYCMAAARLDRLYLKLFTANEQAAAGEEVAPVDNLLTRIEATERNLLTFASKLGLTPESRARLAKKRAEAAPDEPDGDLYD